ncbi:AbrB family transcriptional regulator [Ornithinibacillus sp. 179-J 7C1 HS]|uniref:AbrB family transcriptional regulator n=1 Tax=Ornithinibacillus sp. 179-J 7C1 HS TaxID=3142384 RepID=UPI0039A2DFB8
MSLKTFSSIVEAFIIAIIGGVLFNSLHTPLPWVLGPLTFIVLWQGITKRKVSIPNFIRDSGFIILGIYFGLYFTKETLLTVIPYLLPYILVTCILIVACIVLGTLVTKWIKVDQVTSVFSCIPGGLSEMAVASESLKANPSLVVIFQTIRLITVLFTIPSFMVYVLGNAGTGGFQRASSEIVMGSGWSYLWFIVPIAAAILLQNKIPAGIIIGALGVTAIMNVSPIELASVPSGLLNAGQVAVGASLGKNILFHDLKIGGKYTFVYFGLSILIIAIAFGLGAILATFTSLDYATALLGIAPGGFFEMVLTAYNVGGDPAIVSALQLTRILLIVLLVPVSLKWWFTRRSGIKQIVES